MHIYILYLHYREKTYYIFCLHYREKNMLHIRTYKNIYKTYNETLKHINK